MQLQNALNNFFLWRKGAGYADMAEHEVHTYLKLTGTKVFPERHLHKHHEEHAKTVRGQIAIDHTHRGDEKN